MKLIPAIVFAALVLFLSACASVDGVSKPISFPSNSQYKLKSVAHWKLMAQDVASQAAARLKSNNQAGIPIYLRMPNEATTFEHNFLPFLRAALLNEGLTISSQPEGAADLQIQVDKVSHAAVHRAGTFALLGAGLMVVRDAVLHNAYHLTPEGGVAAGAAADLSMQTEYSAPPDLELTLTVSIQNAGQYLFAETDIYYLSSDDRWVYENPPKSLPNGRVFEVKGGGR
jgi:hypothetical protein